MTNTKTEARIQTDIIISGGGMIGMATAVALAQNNLDVALIDLAPPQTALAPAFDGRASAIAFASYRMLDAIGVWDAMSAHAQPINDIRVSDNNSPLFIHFDHNELGDGPLGFLVENRHIRHALDQAVAKAANITRLAPDRIADLVHNTSNARATLESGQTIDAKLVISAEGRTSPLREGADIRTMEWSYRQTGIVATVEHEYDHQGVAHERFMPGGPFAILPLTGNRSSLVWTEATDIAATIMTLGERGFNAEMRKRFGDFLGHVETVGPRWSYPLNFHHAETYVGERLALVGDAAHGIHPIAGQGLNLGLRDVATLAQVLVETTRCGLDIGTPLTLERYEKWRRVDNLTLSLVTDGLNRLFSNDIGPIRIARDLGLGAVQQIPPLKKFFMKHARGTVGHLPRLLEGTPL